jgi:hypothetical protein
MAALRRLLVLSLTAFVIGGAPLGAGKAWAGVEVSPCSPQVRAVLTSLEISSLEVANSTTGDITEDRRGGTSRVGYQVWLALTDKPGKLVLEFNTRCQFKQAYTRGGLELAGVKAF